MSKRALNILIIIIILGVIAGIVGYFVSPDFQNWVHIWLGDPVGLAATATSVAALSTLLAVIVGLRGIAVGRALAREAFEQTERALDDGRHHFIEAQYNASRPLLVPVAPDLTEQYDVDVPITFDWNNDTSFVTIQNVGVGIAINIWIAMLPPALATESITQYASRLGSPLAAGSGPVKVYLNQGATQFQESDHVQGYTLSVPPERAAGLAERADHFLARLSITYQDIFGRKHASLFDLSDRGIWVNVAFLTPIERDLGDLDAARQRVVVVATAES